jgi:ribosome assembly protein YihI (activator of Der GTPase)
VGAARTPRTPAGSARSAAAARCSDLLQELQLGQVLSEEKQAWFDRECKR